MLRTVVVGSGRRRTSFEFPALHPGGGTEKLIEAILLFKSTVAELVDLLGSVTNLGRPRFGREPSAVFESGCASFKLLRCITSSRGSPFTL